MIQFAHRIVLTEKCNMSCPHCFNAGVREDRTMDVDLLLRFINENNYNLETSVLKIMGGEPTINPRIKEVIREACKYYHEVSLYTNGTKMQDLANDPVIVKHHFGGKLHYTINGFTFNQDGFYKYVEFIRFVSLHFVIPLNNHRNIVKKIKKCMEMSPKVVFVLSPDTQLNLIEDEPTMEKYRKVWFDALNEIVPMLRFAGIPFNYDHRFPMCFYTQDMIDKFHEIDLDLIHKDTTTCCAEEYMGLIGYNFDVYYCNQTQIKLGSLLNDDGSLKSAQDLNKMIQEGTRKKVEQITELSDKCKQCGALPTCKVGCYYNSLKRGSDG